MRKKGIATALLQRVCDDAKIAGFSYVEAYPVKNTKDCFINYHGYLSMFEKVGFIQYKELENYFIVRKSL